jgi:predicted DsbA family dithiol-disulfide isomerase
MMTLKFEFWLDYLSPLCYKQHQSLEILFKKYNFKDLDVLYRSYEMIPKFNPSNDCNFVKILSHHHILTEDEVQVLFDNIPKDLKPVKVIDVHRLSHLAKKYDLSYKFNQLVFRAYYEQKQDISDHQVLKEISLEIGLDLKEVDNVLSTDRYLDAVKLNRENAIVKGIFEVPHIRIDGRVKLTCYHNDDQLFMALNQASAKYSKTDYCEGENCERKKTR